MVGTFGLLLFCLAAAQEAGAMPVSLDKVGGADGVYLADSAFFLLDSQAEYSIEQAGAPLLQSRYARLSGGLPLTKKGVLWLRFSLINALADNRANASGSASAAGGADGASSVGVAGKRVVLRLQEGSPEARVYVARELGSNGEVRRWREISALENGDFPLPDPGKLPLTVYVKLAGTPGLWFNPKLFGVPYSVMPDALTGLDGATPAATSDALSDALPATSDNSLNLAALLPLFLQLLLGACLFFCLLRGISRREEWRLWAGAVIGCALVQAVFCRQAPELGGIYLTTLPSLLAPGLTIMLMPHLGRHLLGSKTSRSLDLGLVLLSLPGMVAALAPLLPGFEWTAKLLPLVPLLLLPLALLALGALFSRRSGACAYLLICLPPLAGAVLALLGLIEARGQAAALEAAPVLAAALASPLYLYGPDLVLWGYAAAALVMALASPAIGNPAGAVRKNNLPLELFGAADMQPQSNPSGDLLPDFNGLAFDAAATSDTLDGIWPEAAADSVDAETAVDTADTTIQDALPQVTEDAAFPENAEDTIRPVEDMSVLAPLYAEPSPIETAGASDMDPSGEMDENMVYIPDPEEPGLVIIKARETVEPQATDRKTLEREALGLETSTGRPGPVLAEYFDKLRRDLEDLKRQQSNAESMTDNLEEILHGLGQALNNLDRMAHGKDPEALPEQSIFNLTSLVRSVHAEMLPLAEERGVALAWFVSPLLPVLYKGDEDALRNALSYMLHGTVESAEAGAVQLAVRQASPTDSADKTEPAAGNGMIIQFSLIDSSMGPHSLRRPARVLSRAWELARASQGSFSIEFSPTSGTSINFSLCLIPLLDKDNAWAGDAKLKDLASRAEAGQEVTGTEEATLAESGGVTETEKAALLETGPEVTEAEEITLAEADEVVQPDTEPEVTETVVDMALAEKAALAVATEVAVHSVDPADEDLLLLTVDTVLPSADNMPADNATHVEMASADYPGEAETEVVFTSEPEDVDEQQVVFAPEILAERDSIVIMDMAASGRRIISRRLEGLPHKRLEVASCREIVQAAAGHNIALIIVDADIPEAELRAALYAVNAAEAASGRPPVPSLGLVSHFSQTARLRRAGCTVCQVKTESREDFQREILRLAPRPEVEIMPESALAAALSPEKDFTPKPIIKHERPDRSVPMLDLIVSSLDAESSEGDSAAQKYLTNTGNAPEAAKAAYNGRDQHKPAGPAPAANAQKPARELILLSGSRDEHMDAAMLSYLPDFLIVLKEALSELSSAVLTGDAALVGELAGRMEKQGSSYGLNNLERMAACVKRAADAGDQEAIRDLSEELMNLVRRYLPLLRITYDDHTKV
jgi:hypothetical protein